MTIFDKLKQLLKDSQIGKIHKIENPNAKEDLNLVVGISEEKYFLLMGFGLDDNISNYPKFADFRYTEADYFPDRVSEVIQSEFGEKLENCNINLYMYNLFLIGELKPVLSDKDADINYPYLVDGGLGSINIQGAICYYVEQELQGKGLSQSDIDQITFNITLQLYPMLEEYEIKFTLEKEIPGLDQILESLGGPKAVIERAKEKARNLQITNVEYQGEKYELIGSSNFEQVGHYQLGLEIPSIEAFGSKFIQIGSFYRGKPT